MRRLTFEYVKKQIQSSGSKLKSDSYKNSLTSLEIECPLGHIYFMSYGNFSQGHRCPTCSQSISERICRKVFEVLFNEKFPKTRPLWLQGKHGRTLELDGYCEKLKMAFEYQGKNHFETRFFHKDQASLDALKGRDELKRNLCKEKGIALIEIPYTVAIREIPKFIYNQCKNLGIDCPKLKPRIKWIDVFPPNKIKELQEIAKERKGKCLSRNYFGRNAKYMFECEKGHRWKMTAADAKHGRWCPHCAGKRQNIHDAQRICDANGLICLSKRFRVDAKLKLMCKAKHHEFRASLYSIKALHTGCPDCYNLRRSKSQRLPIERLKKILKDQGFELLSDYVNNRTKIRVLCKNWHLWDVAPSTILYLKLPCPGCSGTKKLSLINTFNSIPQYTKSNT